MTTKRLRLIIVGAIALAGLVGCGGPEDGDAPSVVEEPILGGGVISGMGAVEVLAYGGGFINQCTGVMISRRLLLTAAHCFEHSLGSATMGTVDIDVNYPTSGTSWTCLTQTKGTGKCTKRLNTWVRRLSGASSPTIESDIAVVYRSNEFGGLPWRNTTASDYQALSTVAPALLSSIMVHGVGLDGNHAGTMRFADFPLQGVDSTTLTTFSDTHMLCPGDSGGPWYGRFVTFFGNKTAVAGLSKTGSPSCRPVGPLELPVFQFAHRITTSDIDFIKTELSFVDPGQTCRSAGGIYSCF